MCPKPEKVVYIISISVCPSQYNLMLIACFFILRAFPYCVILSLSFQNYIPAKMNQSPKFAADCLQNLQENYYENSDIQWFSKNKWQYRHTDSKIYGKKDR